MAIVTYLRKLISTTHLAEEKGKITHNTKDRIIAFYNRTGRTFLKTLTNADYEDHVSGHKTFFGQGSWKKCQTHTLCMIDIDCHAKGTLDGANQFAIWLKDNYFPDLFFETSTSGKGVHAYLIIDKLGAKHEVNDAITHLQAFLCQFVNKFDISGVETKGHLPIFKWKDNHVIDIKSGTNFKLPRGDFSQTYQCDYIELSQLQVIIPFPPSSRGNSCCQISEKELKASLTAAETLIRGQETSFTKIDLAQFIAILLWKTNHPNKDGSMPTELFKKVTTSLYQEGFFTRGWDCQRHKQMRDFLSDLGFIEWTSEEYTRPSQRGAGDGKAACWFASERLFDLVENNTHTLLRLVFPEEVGKRPKCVGFVGDRSESLSRIWTAELLTEFLAA